MHNFVRSLARSLCVVQMTALAVDASGGQPPAPQVTQSVTATATFGPRTSVQVSSQILRFHVADASGAAEMTVDFAAGGRAPNGSDVLLLVQVADSAVLPVEVAAGALTIAGGTTGTIAGTVSRHEPVVVARWAGSGLRAGRLTFRLHAAPGRYDIPVSFLAKLSNGV